MTTVSIDELSNRKHPIHLRILNKSLYQQYFAYRRLSDCNWTENEALIQADQTNPQSYSYTNKVLKQFQQPQTNNSSFDDDLEPVHPSLGNKQQAMAMPPGASSTFHQSSLPSQQPSTQTVTQPSNWNKSNAGSTNSQHHCKLPSSTYHQLSAGNNKCCYNVAFSNDGSKIACCASVFTAYMSTEKRSSIFIYEIPGIVFLYLDFIHYNVFKSSKFI